MITLEALRAALDRSTDVPMPIAAHKRILSPGTLLVEGLRGAGKSWLIQHLISLDPNEPPGPRFGATPLPGVTTFVLADPLPPSKHDEADSAARLSWLIAAMHTLHGTTRVDTPALPDAELTTERALAWFTTLHQALQARNASVMLLYDAPTGPVGALLGLWLALTRRFPHLSARVFLRPGTLTHVTPKDAQDLRHATTSLVWSGPELVRLLAARLHRAAPHDDFGPLVGTSFGLLPETPSEEAMVAVVGQIAGRHVGTGVRRAYTSRWLLAAIQGRRGQGTPATLLDVLSAAVDFRRNSPLEDPLAPPLDLSALEVGLATTARRAVVELSEDLGLGDALWALRELGTPVAATEAVALWGQPLTDLLVREGVLIAVDTLLDVAPLYREGLGVRSNLAPVATKPREPVTPRPKRAPTTPSAEVRDRLVDALQLDLVGPDADDPSHARYAQEQLPARRPSNWYLTGFLVPFEAPAPDDTASEQLDVATSGGAADDDTTPERASTRRAPFPSAIGISLLIPAGIDRVEVDVTWGDYTPDEPPPIIPSAELVETQPATPEEPTSWTRRPRRERVVVRLDTKDPMEVPDSGGLQLRLYVRPVRHTQGARPTGLPDHTLAASIFLVNERETTDPPDLAYAFQAQLSVRCAAPFVTRPDLRGQQGGEWDDRVAELQYRDVLERAVGHGLATRLLPPSDGWWTAQTTWLPSAEVERVEPSKRDGIELNMERLGALTDVDAVGAALGDLGRQYGDWLRAQGEVDTGRPDITRDLLDRAHRARRRIEEGIGLLSDPKVLQAFRFTNQAMADAARQRASVQRRIPADQVEAPRWRPFQIAFLLLNLRGIVEPTHPDRETVDLLFFPTGGGKTEAYLGLAAFTLVWRRLTHPGLTGCGMAVLMRYTLRLLTFEQLGRAAALICALERSRWRHRDLLGEWPFEIGLWVGKAATPNRMGHRGDSDPDTARLKVERYQREKGPSPIPLESCPWCGTRFRPTSFDLRPNAHYPTDLRLLCANRACPFSGRNPLPIVTVDEPIYRRLPCFLVATVDKLAQLPWVGEAGKLLGKAERYDAQGFYGATEPHTGLPLPSGGLLPPDLIIQDELHLISGPLGTMVGLYETAIDALSTREEDAKIVRPKVIASTATVRRAEQQVRALFDRESVELFPPPGPDRRDSFFAETVAVADVPGRRYIGVAAQGRSMRVVFLRTMLALMGAAQAAWEEAGGSKVDPNPADPYMSVIAYFNSLRELGGSRRIVEDEVRSRLFGYGGRRRLGEARGPFRKREIKEPVELTSRESTSKVANTKRRLELTFHEEERVDVALATNMISVGLDITRLGLMVVSGQPKMSAEYIQATSRVGRDPTRPGLVITLMNLYRPRDRSHYEHFTTWHDSFYRSVEATSVTPFSPRAVDRGIAGVTVSVARHSNPRLTASTNAEGMLQERAKMSFVAEAIGRRAGRVMKDPEAEQKTQDRVSDLLDAWAHIAETNHDVGAGLRYQRGEAGDKPVLLRDPLDPELPSLSPEQRRFRAHRSMRDVEPSVNLWARTLDGHDVASEDE